MSTGNVVIGADWCHYCNKVKHHLKKNKIPYEYVDTETPEGAERRKVESEKYNWNTIPLIFIDGKFVGGCDDFFKGLADNTITLTKP